MFLYLAEGKTGKDLERYGFRDCGDCYRWTRVYTDEVLGVVGQDTIEISRGNRIVKFIASGRCNYKGMVKFARLLIERDILKEWEWDGKVVIPNFGDGV